MDIGTIAVIALPSLGVGGVVGSVLRGRTIRLLRSTLSAREATVASLQGRVENLTRKNGRANAEVERLTPLAERGKRAIASQLKASAASAAKRAQA
jgi:hypothetical protein